MKLGLKLYNTEKDVQCLLYIKHNRGFFVSFKEVYNYFDSYNMNDAGFTYDKL